MKLLCSLIVVSLILFSCKKEELPVPQQSIPKSGFELSGEGWLQSYKGHRYGTNFLPYMATGFTEEYQFTDGLVVSNFTTVGTYSSEEVVYFGTTFKIHEYFDDSLVLWNTDVASDTSDIYIFTKP